jgi:hypothetical protein
MQTHGHGPVFLGMLALSLFSGGAMAATASSTAQIDLSGLSFSGSGMPVSNMGPDSVYAGQSAESYNTGGGDYRAQNDNIHASATSSGAQAVNQLSGSLEQGSGSATNGYAQALGSAVVDIVVGGSGNATLYLTAPVTVTATVSADNIPMLAFGDANLLLFQGWGGPFLSSGSNYVGGSSSGVELQQGGLAPLSHTATLLAAFNNLAPGDYSVVGQVYTVDQVTEPVPELPLPLMLTLGMLGVFMLNFGFNRKNSMS